mgnify:CR=1 FL=1
MKYVDSNGNPKLSGDNSFEDVVNRVLDDMWDELNVALPDDEEEDSPKKRKHNKVSADIVCELDTDDDGSNLVADDKKRKSWRISQA